MSEAKGWLVMAAVCGVLYLLYRGAMSLWVEWREPPGDCYYYLANGPELCVLARPPGAECVSLSRYADLTPTAMLCTLNAPERAATFVSQSGRRVCGQAYVAFSCPARR